MLLAIAGTSVHGSTVVQGSDEPSLESTKVYRNFGSAWVKATAQAPDDAVLEVAPAGRWSFGWRRRGRLFGCGLVALDTSWVRRESIRRGWLARCWAG